MATKIISRWVLRFLLFTIFTLFLIVFDATFGVSVNSDNQHSNLPISGIYFRHYRLTNEESSREEYARLDKSFDYFLRKWQLAGASIAIAKDGKLVYAKGFGYANKEEKIPAEPYNIFRIASVSKLITATAVMKLVEQQKLSLDDRVFGMLGILNDDCYQKYKDPRIEMITVRNLLNHSAGWSPRWGDHMFMNEEIARSLKISLPVSLQDIVVFALSKRLHFNPGSHSSYSNLGYAILQLVIEKTTGKPYEEYVNESIFFPLGIYDAHIARNFDNMRYADETRYYEVPEADPVKTYDGRDSLVLKSRGGNDIQTLGAAGGWVISSVSLMKFILAIDGSASQFDILSQNSINQMVERNGRFQPLGWRWVMPNGKWWRSGSFPGTSALAVVRNDGYSYVFLTNSSPWTGARFPYEVDRMMSRALGLIKVWPDINLLSGKYSPYIPWEVQADMIFGFTKSLEFSNLVETHVS